MDECGNCRSRDRQGPMMSGAIGGGFLLAGFGIPWAIVGMILGAPAGYLAGARDGEGHGDRADPPAG